MATNPPESKSKTTDAPPKAGADTSVAPPAWVNFQVGEFPFPRPGQKPPSPIQGGKIGFTPITEYYTPKTEAPKSNPIPTTTPTPEASPKQTQPASFPSDAAPRSAGSFPFPKQTEGQASQVDKYQKKFKPAGSGTGSPFPTGDSAPKTPGQKSPWAGLDGGDLRPQVKMEKRYEHHEADKAMAIAEATGKKLVVIYSAPWCGPCRDMKDIYRAVEEKYAGKVVFLHQDKDSVDADPNHPLGPIDGVPAMRIYDVERKDRSKPFSSQNRRLEIISEPNAGKRTESSMISIIERAMKAR